MNLIQAFSPQIKVCASIPHPCGMGLKYIGLSALVCSSGVELLKCLIVEVFAGRHPPCPPSKGEERSEGGCHPYKGGKHGKRRTVYPV